VCYYTCEGPNHAALLSSVQLDVSLFRPSFLFVKLVNFITLLTLLLLRPLGGVIFIYNWFLLLCFTLCPFVTKMGSNFYSWTGNVFPNRSSDFCPRMAKWGVC
jgi:hypothetical protein